MRGERLQYVEIGDLQYYILDLLDIQKIFLLIICTLIHYHNPIHHKQVQKRMKK